MRRSVIGSYSVGRSGFALWGGGPWLVLAMLAGGGIPVTTPGAVGGLEDAGTRGALYPDEFPLFPTLGNEGASGVVRLRQPWSPFGVSVDEEGRVRYDVAVEVRGLPTADGASYRVWLTTPSFEPVRELGAIEPDGRLTGETIEQQLIVVVTRETRGRRFSPGDRWDGPVVLRGFSAGARVKPLASHSLFQQTPM